MLARTKTRRISIIIPIHNEEKLLKSSLDSLIKFCADNGIDPEILACENGSTDNTREILSRYKSSKVRKLFLESRGLGAAYKQGIIEATTEYIYFTGIDFPFGYRNITDSLPYLEEFDLVFSSKAHPQSKINAPFMRKIVSFVFRTIMKTLLPIKVGDPQGCLTARAGALKDIEKFCDSTSAFFQTQTALYAHLLGYATAEIPVEYVNPRIGSKFSIRKDGTMIFRQILNERNCYTRKLTSHHRRISNSAKHVTVPKV